MQYDIAKKLLNFGAIVAPNFGTQMAQYTDLLIRHNAEFSLMSSNETRFIGERHLPDCAAFLLLHKAHAGARFLDYGSGGGFPGIVLAAAQPTCSFVLAESTSRKTEFLKICVRELALDNVEVFLGRANTYNFAPAFDYILMRAVGPLHRTIDDALRIAPLSCKVIVWAGPDILAQPEYWRTFAQKRKAHCHIAQYPEGYMDNYSYALACFSKTGDTVEQN